MADTKDTTPNVFGGFQAIGDILTGSKSGVSQIDTGDDMIADLNNRGIDTVEPDDLKKKLDEPVLDTDDKDKDVDTSTGVDEDKDIDTDDKDVDIDDKDKDVDKDKDTDVDVDPKDLEDFKKMEGDLATFFRDRLGEELNWEFEKDEKFESIKDLVDYMQDVVEVSSQPDYANDEIKQLDAFVKDGGNLREFFKETSTGGLDLEVLDLEKESNQRAVVRELLSAKGYSEERSTKTINRYEDAGVLDAEAEDAVELLKDYRKEKSEKLLDSQKKEAGAVKEQQQKFFSNVEQYIKSLKDIKGISISEKEKQDLLSYIFRPKTEGITEYQKAYASNVAKNIVESAFFTRQGDALIVKAKKGGASDAYKDIHQKLQASKGKRHAGSGSQGDSGDSDMLGLLGKNLLRKI